MNTFSAFWQREPFVRLLLPFVVGIIVGLYMQVYVSPVWLLLGLSTAVLCMLLLSLLPKYREILSTVQLSVLFITGFVVVRLYDTGISPGAVQHMAKQNGYVYGYVVSDIDVKNGKEVCTVELTRCANTDGAFHKTTGNALLYVSVSAGLHYGDGVCVPAKDINSIPPPINPYEFDYKSYLYRQQIYAVIYAQQGDVYIIGERHINYLKLYAYNLNHYTVTQLHRYFTDSNVEGLMEALLIGYRAQIDNTIVQAYTDCGVVHVLAVSGMQVGLVFVLLNWGTFFLKRYKHTRLLQLFIILAGIWLFTAMAGFSGSVVRAAVMFSFITAGRHMYRHVSMYNILAASAFFILLFDPFAITDVGLQLSYTAVWGIVFMSRRIYSALPIKNKLLDKVWNLTAVSIAAQLAATPLLFYYFHQFPLFFIPANLLAIPVTTFALYAGIAVVALGAVPILSHALAGVTTVLMHLLNNYLFLLQKQPFSRFYTTSWSMMEAIVLASALLALILFVIYRYKACIWIGLVSLLLLAMSHDVKSIEYNERNDIITLHVTHGKAIAIEEGVNCVLVCDSSVQQNTYFMQSYFPKYMHSAGFKQWAVVCLK